MRNMSKLTLAIASSVLFAASACGPSNSGVPGSSAITHPRVTGTIFTIVFENHDQSAVINTQVPYFYHLAQSFGSANAYISNVHPSLPNYIQMLSGSTHGISNDNDPTDPNDQIAGTDNLADQLDAAGVPWRAYMESMGDPCTMTSTTLYAAHHAPFLYYSSLSQNTARCREHVVDFDQNFANDLAANTYRYMWITPNMCNDMHDCSPQTSDAWLQRVVTQIMASPGYQNNGAIFVLFDEGSLRILNASADLPTIVVSPLVTPGYQSNTTFDHNSYLATVEDILGLPRLAATASSTPMSEFFNSGANTAVVASDAGAP